MLYKELGYSIRPFGEPQQTLPSFFSILPHFGIFMFTDGNAFIIIISKEKMSFDFFSLNKSQPLKSV